MSRSIARLMISALSAFVFTATIAFVVAITLPTETVQAQRRSDPPRPAALTAPLNAPLIQTTQGNTPVRLQAATVEIDTHGSLARTTLLLTLFNPNDRLLEGNLQFPLQSDQQVTAFALDIAGVLRDAVPVPKNKAQQVFESIERRGVDPGLLEQTAGNQFRLRIYPIPAHGIRQVRLVIDEAMRRDNDAWRLEVPVHLLAGAERFDLAVRAEGLRDAPETTGAFERLQFTRDHTAYTTQITRGALRPGTGLALRFPAADSVLAYRQRFDDQEYAFAEIPQPSNTSTLRKLPSLIGLLWDASASGRHRDHASEFALLDHYFKAMNEGRVQLRRLRDVGEDAGIFEIHAGNWSALRKTLDTTIYDGASNLGDWRPQPGIREYLLVSDGLQNYGDGTFPKLSEQQSLYALNAAGAQSDSSRLDALAESRGGRLIAWQGSAGVEAAARELLQQGARIVALEGEGITDLQPQTSHADAGPLRITGRMTEPQAAIRVTVDEGGRFHKYAVAVTADTPHSDQVARLWASWRSTALAGEPERHRAAITRLGQQFGLVTPGTSLLVLENIDDYVRYEIPPPPTLRDQVATLMRSQNQQKETSRKQRLDEVAQRFAQRLDWWKRDFPKTTPALSAPEDKQTNADAAGAVAAAADSPPPPPPPPPSAPLSTPAPVREAAAASRARQSDELDKLEVVGSRISTSNEVVDDRLQASRSSAQSARAKKDTDASAGQGVSIKLQPWQPDSLYARRLRDAKADDLYALYLDERDGHADSTAFYLDVGDLLLQKGRRAEALRVLSNLAELDLENRHVLRVLGYRLMQAHAWNTATSVLREVLRLADEEPQSHRDLGLALAAGGDRQGAIRQLYDVVERSWDGRFSEVELVALNELNAIIATSPTPLDTTFIDPRLLKNMPLDLRAVLAWDSDNSDMDLWVTDPNGERCYYGNRNTYQGGLLSDDFTGGYGPEEFVLRDAKPGKYKVEANFFGDRQQIVTGATTLTLTLSTGWGTRQQNNQAVTLRLSGRSETVLVGEFEVK